MISNEKNGNSKRKIGILEKFSYGCGDLASNIIYASMSAFLVFYYTDVVNVSAAAIGTIMLVSRFLDGITDLIMGIIVDRTKSKYGKARPWLLRMSIPFAVAAFLMYSVPNIGENVKLIYIFITYNIVTTIYTSINIPYGVLSSLMTNDQYERSVLNIIRSIFALVGTIVINMCTLPIVDALGGNSRAWSLTYLILGTIATILFLITFFFTKERVGSNSDVVVNGKRDDVPVIIGLKGLLKNKYWIILTANGLTSGVVLAIALGSNVYYSKYILNDPNIVGILTTAFMIPVVICLMFIAPLVKKIGKRNISLVGIMITVLGYVLIFLYPTNVTLVIVGCVIRGIGTAPMIGVGFAMIADCVEYGEWKTGNRTAGLIFSAQSFGGKAGSGLGGALIGWLLAWGGYIGGAAEQSTSAISAIKLMYIVMPLICLTIQFLLLLPYKLDKEYPMILKELEERKK